MKNNANSSHTHSISNITNLQTTLDSKANINHTHSYANSSHTHSISNITNLQTKLNILTDAIILKTQSKTAIKIAEMSYTEVTFTDDTPDGYKLISLRYRSNSTAYIHWYRTDTVCGMIHFLGGDTVNAPTITRYATYAKSELF